jgi:hypothetical protein
VFLQVSAHYLAHDDTVAGVVNLVKNLKIKRIVIVSRSELKLHIKQFNEKYKYLFTYAALSIICIVLLN